MKKILYLGWIGHKNLGDDMMWHLFRDMSSKYLKKKGYRVIPLLPHVNINKITYDIVVLGGGSIITPNYINIVYNALKKGKRVYIWGSGFDRMGKSEMELLLQNKLDRKQFDPKTISKLNQVIMHAPSVGIRGPLTYKLFKDLGVNMKKAKISGDPGFILHLYRYRPEPKDSNVWTGVNKVIGINWGTSLNKIFGEDELRVENELVAGVKKLIQKGYKIYIYPVWDKDIEACTRLYHHIGDNENVRMTSKLYNQHELRSIIKHFSFTINFKLHPNIISVAADVPFIALGYRFKVFDFSRSLALERLVISTDSPNIEQQLLQLEQYISQQRKEIISTYHRQLAIYHQRLLKPFFTRF